MGVFFQRKRGKERRKRRTFRVSVLALEAYRYRQRVVPKTHYSKSEEYTLRERERESKREGEREIRPRSRQRARSSESISLLERQSRGERGRERERLDSFYPPLFSIEFFCPFWGWLQPSKRPKREEKEANLDPSARGRGRRRSLRRERSADEGLTLGCVLILVLPHNIT